jgi:Relaxase/Mobilisation nuclease domain
MIVKLFKSGKSFKMLATYLLHDAEKAETNDRVRWTHTLNLASDHPSLAVDEMLWTYRSADALKREAGIKPGGRKLENPVRHFSLNWHPSESPSREHMIETVESFLGHMGWGEHQALIANHTDKSHIHVHVMCSAVNPNTGCALDSSFEKRRAQEWAVAYERAHDLIFCEERLKPIEERTPSPTRATWEKLRASERDYNRSEAEMLAKEFVREVDDITRSPKDNEWKILKAHQRREREQFFIDGKEAYRTVRTHVYREVREEFRDEWRGYFEAKRAGGDRDALESMKADILKRQNATLDEQRNEACAQLRARRDADYKTLLKCQQKDRAELRVRQAEGESADTFLEAIAERPWRADTSLRSIAYPRSTSRNIREGFHRAADALTKREEPAPRAETRRPFESEPHERRLRVNNAVDAVGGLGMGALAAIAVIGERLFDGFFGGGEAHPEKPVERAPDHEEERQDKAAAASERQTATETRAAEEAALLASWEARRRRRERD